MKTFIDQHTAGFDRFQRDVDQTHWSEITAQSGVDRAQISEIAARYARAKSAVFAWGMGMTHH